MKRSFKSGELTNEFKEGGKYYRKAIICRTGIWNGDVLVDEKVLKLIANFNNETFSTVINENSYPPIQIEHERNTDEVLGRIDIGKMELSVEEAKKYHRKWDGHVLMATLRVDDSEAIKKIKSGKYNHLSISFDDETGELYEVSFVAVEAARGSQILNHQNKDKKMPKELAEYKAKQKTLSLKVNAMVKTNVATDLAIKNLATNLSQRTTDLDKSIAGLELQIKSTEITSKFKALMREGKLNKAEFDTIDFNNFAEMPQTALSAVLKSYESRTPSIDLRQFGSASENGEQLTVELSDEQYKKALDAQLKGKELSLEELGVRGRGDNEAKEKDKLAEEKPDEKGEKYAKEKDGEKSELASDEPMDMSAVLKEIQKIKEDMAKLKKLSEDVDALKKLSDESEKEELAAEKDEEELDDDSDKDKNNDKDQ